MERCKKNIKALKEQELEKEKAEIEAMRAKRKMQEKQLKIMKKDLPRIQADNEKALRDIHELQQSINNHKTTCSADVIEKMQGIENLDREFVEQLSKQKQLKDAQSKLKDDIAALKASTTQEISMHENAKNDIFVTTINLEKRYATISRKSREVEENIKKTKLELTAEKITLEKVERGAAIIKDTMQREKELLGFKQS
ncbi:predicted protein [Chaetoceros tenuissimus]|uniref:Coiled-coil domain-containing protein 39 n=1 Tax=Chaetoceros tenuissimus TaxID=426638 RepID=A0AAD3H6M7_9STRA|nr:predicted protein [Chaetoceros tenuissimus]